MSRTAALLATATLTAGLLGAAVPTASAAPYCGITWGSTPEQAAAGGTGDLVGARAGRHACFDRLVLDVAGGSAGGYSVQYVGQVSQDGSDLPVPTRGGEALQVIVHAPAADDAGHPTYTPADPRELVPVAGFTTFRQVAWAGSFEGQSTVALGVRARLPFRAFVVPGPGTGARLVVDVAHRW